MLEIEVVEISSTSILFERSGVISLKKETSSNGAAHIGKSLVPTEGPKLTFHFEETPGAEIIAIDQHAYTIKSEEAILLPAINEQYREDHLS